MQLFNASEYLLDRRVAGDADRTAVLAGDRRLTYGDLLVEVERTAGGLSALGLLPEQRLLMVVVDCPEFVVLYLAAMRSGAVPVPVSTMLRARHRRAARRFPRPRGRGERRAGRGGR